MCLIFCNTPPGRVPEARLCSRDQGIEGLMPSEDAVVLVVKAFLTESLQRCVQSIDYRSYF